MKSKSIEQYRDEMIEVTRSGIIIDEASHGHLLKSSLPRSDTYGTRSEESAESSDENAVTGHGDPRKKRRRCILWILLFVVVTAVAAVAAIVLTSQQSTGSDSVQALTSDSGLAGPAEDRPGHGPGHGSGHGPGDSSSDDESPATPQNSQDDDPEDPPDDSPEENSPEDTSESNSPTGKDSPPPQATPSAASPNPTAPVSNRPTFAPVPLNDNDEVIILAPEEKLFPDSSIASPNGRYIFEFTSAGDLRLFTSNGDLLWSVNEGGGDTLSMQWDGNMVFRTASKSVIWSTSTSQHPDASLRLDNLGRLAIISSDGVTPLWMEGVPGSPFGPSSILKSLTFPVRGAFYYPWFPETWGVNGSPVFYNPTLGKYSNGNRTAQISHIESLNYAHVDLAIASWWGQNAKKDRARITNLMDKSTQYGIKWTIYHEQERKLQPSVQELRADLAYLKKWFAWHEAWAHIDGKPLIFVWNKGDCNVSDRWMEAASDEWYIVVKKLDRTDCPSQPDHWHQYGPSNAIVHEEGYSFSVSPGFWQANMDTPNLPRLSADAFRSNVIAMVESGEPWQLITTFNEWGEGTAIESADEWASPSGYGIYLDVLNQI